MGPKYIQAFETPLIKDVLDISTDNCKFLLRFITEYHISFHKSKKQGIRHKFGLL
jgi:hypothetical protein